MNAKVTLSTKGQVVIPKDVRDQLGLMPGQTLDVELMGGRVILTPQIRKSGRSFDEILAEVRTLITYDGPSVTVEEMNETIADGWRKAAEDSDR